MKLTISKSIGNFVILILILLVTYYIYNYTFNSPYLITSEVAKILLRTKNIDIILDVRTKFERETLGFFPNSVNIQASELTNIMPKMYPNKNNLILVYCNTGQRARKAIDILQNLGYKNSLYIAGSYLTIQEKIFR